MALVVNTNVSSMVALNSLNRNTDALNKTMEQLSTGYRINSAKDDSAGLSISQGMLREINGNEKAIGNIQDGSNLISVAEGALTSIGDHLQRIRELCVQVASGTYSENDRKTVITEIQQRLEDINLTAKRTTFNGITLLDGVASKDGLKLQIGANSLMSTNTLNIGPALSNCLLTASAGAIGLNIAFVADGISAADNFTTSALTAGTSFTAGNWTDTEIRRYMERLDVAIDTVVQNRSLLGGYGNRLDSTMDNLLTMNENLERTKSRIMDLDIAEASANLVKQQILQQSASTILSQANQSPSIALSLLG